MIHARLTKSWDRLIHIAIHSKCINFVKELVEYGTAEDLAIENLNKDTGLSIAAVSGMVEIAKLMIEKNNKLLDSKTLGTKYIRTSMCIVLVNHDQNLESRFRLLKVCLFVKLKSSDCRIYLSKFARLDRSKIKLDRLNLVQIIFSTEFPTQPKPSLTCRVLYFTPSIKGKTLATFLRLLMCCVLNLL